MKSYTIPSAEPWDTFLTTFQDGNAFSEANIDTLIDTIGKRLSALKALDDAKVSISVANTYTARQAINPTVNALIALKVWGEFGFAETADGARAATSGILFRQVTLTDASTTQSPTCDSYVIPVITAARVYTFGSPAGNPGRRIRITRRDATSAFTATIKDAGANTIAVMAASAASWVDIEDTVGAGTWHVVAWGGIVGGAASVTSIA